MRTRETKKKKMGYGRQNAPVLLLALRSKGDDTPRLSARQEKSCTLRIPHARLECGCLPACQGFAYLAYLIAFGTFRHSESEDIFPDIFSFLVPLSRAPCSPARVAAGGSRGSGGRHRAAGACRAQEASRVLFPTRTARNFVVAMSGPCACRVVACNLGFRGGRLVWPGLAWPARCRQPPSRLLRR